MAGYRRDAFVAPEEMSISVRQERHVIFIGLIALMVLAAGLRAGFVFRDGEIGALRGSHIEYFRAGKRLAIHGAFLSAWPTRDDVQIPSAMMPPVYTGVVAAAYLMAGENDATTAKIMVIFNIACSIALVPVCFFVGRSMISQRAGWIAAFIVCTHPLLIAFNGLIWDTSLFALLIGCCVWGCAVLVRQDVTVQSFFIFGLLLGLTALVNPALTVLYPILVLWPALRNRRCHAVYRRPMAKAVVGSIIGCGMVLLPWIVRNYQAFDRIIYVRNGLWMQVWLGAIPGTENLRDGVWARHYPLNNGTFDTTAPADWATAEHEFLARCRSGAIETISNDPVRWLVLCANRACDYWLGTTFTHGTGRFAFGGPTRWALMIYLTIESGILLMVLLGLWRCRTGMRPWAVGCVLFSLVYCCTIVMLRFRAPAEPIAAIVMATAFESIMRKTES